jgi:quinol monooxygenase YgiN
VVIATFRLFPPREQRRQLLSILRSVQGPTKVQPHCTSCQVYEEDGYEEAILYLEHWDSEPEFHRHVRSDQYRQVLEAVELSRRNPEIQFHQVGSTRGIDLLEELRSRDGVLQSSPAETTSSNSP